MNIEELEEVIELYGSQLSTFLLSEPVIYVFYGILALTVIRIIKAIMAIN